MEQIALCTQALIDAIHRSDAYRNFMIVKEKIDKDPELKTKLNDFRRRSYELQNRKEGKDFYTEIERFEVEFHELRKETMISEFLQNEMEICRIIQQVNMDLALHVDLDIAGFQDSIK